MDRFISAALAGRDSRLMFILLCLLIGFWAVAAEAKIPAHFYEQVRNNFPLGMRDYIGGLHEGVRMMALFDEEVRSTPPLFCNPDKSGGGDPNDFGILLLDKEIKRRKDAKRYDPSTPIEIIMVFAFANEYPCR